MGLGHAGPHPQYTRLVSERYISEKNQPLFYRRWEEVMKANNQQRTPPGPTTLSWVEMNSTEKGVAALPQVEQLIQTLA